MGLRGFKKKISLLLIVKDKATKRLVFSQFKMKKKNKNDHVYYGKDLLVRDGFWQQDICIYTEGHIYFQGKTQWPFLYDVTNITNIETVRRRKKGKKKKKIKGIRWLSLLCFC